MQKKKSGFTLVEVMCAISIIALLALVVVPDIRAYIIKTRKLVVIAQTHNAMKAIDTHNMFSSGSDYIRYADIESETTILEAKEIINDDTLLSEDDISKIKKLGLCAAKLIVKDDEALKFVEIYKDGNFCWYNRDRDMSVLKTPMHKYGYDYK
ncbi:Hypothetical protein CM240_1343 [Clostridium bornimense]|uniref:Prepilin-type N-terminal cleavage/methylation domain-containing protein n=1 Tax=Clostridium bornimense TaxID=1216932 RepID=W6S2H4_9CLOT|nr:type II secretion system protein [Clostridium bornimense]CDM68502.1 Hypothetical protein CM240_1343 [Clostridium bornimense]